MPFSVDRFLTTHTGSLPRPDDLVQMMYGKEEGKEVDIAALHKRTTTAVREVVDKQRQAGLDIVNDGEMSKPSYATYASLELSEFRKRAAEHVEALNVALENIPPDRTRMHLCWGNYEGPHHCDVPLVDIVDILLKARPAMLSLDAANPRHAHEFAVFEKVKLPEGKALIPGVIESKSNFIEHPAVIANRISNYARLVGRENVIAGSDCGYGTWVGQAAVDPDIVWAKLAALTEGARLASQRFWP